MIIVGFFNELIFVFLYLFDGSFTKIPRCVYELENLEILLAAENQVEEINVSSDALAKLKMLAVLDLSNNSIFTVPPELGNFTHLRFGFHTTYDIV